MRRLIAATAFASVAFSAPALAQTNDDDYTPLNSRIKRDRQFPTTLPPHISDREMSQANRRRSRDMIDQFGKCLWRRSNEKSLALLEQTDFGFVTFAQIGMETSEATQRFGFMDCLSRVAESRNSGLVLRFSAGGLRQWLLQQAYFDRYPDEPDWVKPGYVISERGYPLSANNSSVHVASDFADCIVANDPYNADFFFRNAPESEGEDEAIQALMPALSACIPQGQEFKIDKGALRMWLGEGLWHAANNNAPAEPEVAEDTE